MIDPINWCFVLIVGLSFIHLYIKTLLKKWPRFRLNENVNGNPLKTLPSPKRRFPLIGHLHLFKGNSIVEMIELSKKHGEIYGLQLGNVNTVVVTSLRLIREVLKDTDFLHRPNFLRYNILFGNNKENSLAFCDWSNVQRQRRSVARKFCHTERYANRMEDALRRTHPLLIDRLRGELNNELNEPHKKLKLNLQKACACVFFDFFCSEFYDDWDNDKEFEHVVQLFDEIFWEINQQHPTDVLPFLSWIFVSHLKNLGRMGEKIRQFVHQKIIEVKSLDLEKEHPEDLVEALLMHYNDTDPNNRLSMEQILYELEDFLGGHSAVSNLLCRALLEIGNQPGMSNRIYEKYFEDNVKDYILAVVYETLRRTSSPIVPHVASVNSSIDGYRINKGSMVFLNNFSLNTSEEFWTEPQIFNPERFLDQNGIFKKPAHFFPFSYGKRACMGYQLVEKVTAGLLIPIIKNFNIEALENPTPLPIACVAISPQVDLRLRFLPRY